MAFAVTGDRLPATYSLSPRLTDLLQQMAAARGVPLDALVEFYLYKQLRAEQARRLVGEKPEPVPSSFVNEAVARAKVEAAKDVAAVKGGIEERGDRAARVAEQMEAMLHDATGADEHLEAVQRKNAQQDAMIDMALEKAQKK